MYHTRERKLAFISMIIISLLQVQVPRSKIRRKPSRSSRQDCEFEFSSINDQQKTQSNLVFLSIDNADEEVDYIYLEETLSSRPHRNSQWYCVLGYRKRFQYHYTRQIIRQLCTIEGLELAIQSTHYSYMSYGYMRYIKTSRESSS